MASKNKETSTKIRNTFLVLHGPIKSIQKQLDEFKFLHSKGASLSDSEQTFCRDANWCIERYKAFAKNPEEYAPDVAEELYNDVMKLTGQYAEKDIDTVEVSKDNNKDKKREEEKTMPTLINNNMVKRMLNMGTAEINQMDNTVMDSLFVAINEINRGKTDIVSAPDPLSLL